MTKKGLNHYTVSARVVVEVDIEIKGDSLDDALGQSKELDIGDFISPVGNLIDYDDFRIRGIFETN